MLEDRNLADLPIVIAAIDPCFSCTDRMISIVRADSGKLSSMDWESARQLGIIKIFPYYEMDTGGEPTNEI
jgi:NADH-quinone oxidoreductase subunit D